MPAKTQNLATIGIEPLDNLNSPTLVLLLYGNDIVFVDDQRAMEHFQKAIQKRFKIKIR